MYRWGLTRPSVRKGSSASSGPHYFILFFLLKSSELSNDIRINLLALHNGLKQLCVTKASIIAGQVGDH